MANIKTTLITDIEAGRGVDGFRMGGRLNRIAETFTKPTPGIANGDVIRVMRAWTGWGIDSLVYHGEAWGTGGIAEIGCHDINGGAVIAAQAFGSAIDVSAAVARIDLRAEATNPSNVNQKLRDLLGMAATATDKWVDVSVTATNIGAAQQARCALIMRYVEGN